MNTANNIVTENRNKLAHIVINDKKYHLYNGSNLLGRCKTAVVKLRDFTTSQQQAIITIINNTVVYICDLNSSNGTFINNQQLKPWHIYEIKHDTTLKFGNLAGTFKNIAINETDYSCSQSQNEDSIFSIPTQNLHDNNTCTDSTILNQLDNTANNHDIQDSTANQRLNIDKRSTDMSVVESNNTLPNSENIIYISNENDDNNSVISVDFTDMLEDNYHRDESEESQIFRETRDYFGPKTQQMDENLVSNVTSKDQNVSDLVPNEKVHVKDSEILCEVIYNTQNINNEASQIFREVRNYFGPETQPIFTEPENLNNNQDLSDCDTEVEDNLDNIEKSIVNKISINYDTNITDLTNEEVIVENITNVESIVEKTSSIKETLNADSILDSDTEVGDNMDNNDQSKSKLDNEKSIIGKQITDLTNLSSKEINIEPSKDKLKNYLITDYVSESDTEVEDNIENDEPLKKVENIIVNIENISVLTNKENASRSSSTDLQSNIEKTLDKQSSINDNLNTDSISDSDTEIEDNIDNNESSKISVNNKNVITLSKTTSNSGSDTEIEDIDESINRFKRSSHGSNDSLDMSVIPATQDVFEHSKLIKVDSEIEAEGEEIEQSINKSSFHGSNNSLDTIAIPGSVDVIEPNELENITSEQFPSSEESFKLGLTEYMNTDSLPVVLTSTVNNIVNVTGNDETCIELTKNDKTCSKDNNEMDDHTFIKPTQIDIAADDNTESDDIFMAATQKLSNITEEFSNDDTFDKTTQKIQADENKLSEDDNDNIFMAATQKIMLNTNENESSEAKQDINDQILLKPTQKRVINTNDDCDDDVLFMMPTQKVSHSESNDDTFDKTTQKVQTDHNELPEDDSDNIFMAATQKIITIESSKTKQDIDDHVFLKPTQRIAINTDDDGDDDDLFMMPTQKVSYSETNDDTFSKTTQKVHSVTDENQVVDSIFMMPTRKILNDNEPSRVDELIKSSEELINNNDNSSKQVHENIDEIFMAPTEKIALNSNEDESKDIWDKPTQKVTVEMVDEEQTQLVETTDKQTLIESTDTNKDIENEDSVFMKPTQIVEPINTKNDNENGVFLKSTEIVEPISTTKDVDNESFIFMQPTQVLEAINIQNDNENENSVLINPAEIVESNNTPKDVETETVSNDHEKESIDSLKGITRNDNLNLGSTLDEVEKTFPITTNKMRTVPQTTDLEEKQRSSDVIKEKISSLSMKKIIKRGRPSKKIISDVAIGKSLRSNSKLKTEESTNKSKLVEIPQIETKKKEKFDREVIDESVEKVTSVESQMEAMFFSQSDVKETNVSKTKSGSNNSVTNKSAVLSKARNVTFKKQLNLDEVFSTGGEDDDLSTTTKVNGTKNKLKINKLKKAVIISSDEEDDDNIVLSVRPSQRAKTILMHAKNLTTSTAEVSKRVTRKRSTDTNEPTIKLEKNVKLTKTLANASKDISSIIEDMETTYIQINMPKKTVKPKVTRKTKSTMVSTDNETTVNSNEVKESDDSQEKKIPAKRNAKRKSDEIEPIAGPSKKIKKEEDLSDSMLSPPRLRRQIKPKIIFTMFDNPEMESLIRTLGGSVVDTVDASTILVTSSVKRSQKLLQAVGLGKPICSVKWLEECKKQSKFLDPWDFIYRDNEAETKWNFSLEVSLKRSNTNKLFDGYVVLLIVSKSQDILKSTIEACGGKCVVKATFKALQHFIVVSTIDNKKKYSKYLSQQVLVVEPEAIYDAVLRQELRLENHTLS